MKAFSARAPRAQGDPRVLASVNWKALALATAGLLLTFMAPAHRVDLLLVGLGASLGGLLWWPAAGPLLIGASLPFFFFSRQIVGPIGLTPPGLALLLTWIAVLVRRRRLGLVWPTSP